MELSTRIDRWLNAFSPNIWETAIRQILTADSYMVVDTAIQKLDVFWTPCKFYFHYLVYLSHKEARI